MSYLEELSDAEAQSHWWRSVGHFNVAYDTLSKSVNMFPAEVVDSNYAQLRDATDMLQEAQEEMVRRMRAAG